MSETLIVIGLACVIGAAVGGGLKLKGVEIPVISSLPRQALLAGIGVAVIVGAFAFGREGATNGAPTDSRTTGPPGRSSRAGRPGSPSLGPPALPGPLSR